MHGDTPGRPSASTTTQPASSSASESTTNDTRTDKGRVAVLREFGEALAKTRNAVLIDTHAQKAALRLAVSVESVRAELKKQRPPESREPREATEHDDIVASGVPEEIPAEPPSPRESQLLKLIVCGLPAPEDVIVTTPVRAPVAVGVNVTVMVQVLFCARLAAQVVVRLKSPVAAETTMLLTAPLFAVRVTTCEVLVVLVI